MNLKVLLSCCLPLLLVLPTGCKRKKNQAPPEERGSINRDSGMSGPSDPRYGSQGAIQVTRTSSGSTGEGDATEAESAASGSGEGVSIQRSYRNCRNPVPVMQGDYSTPEGTLWHVFEALLVPDEEEAFQRFYALIDPDYQSMTDARRYWFYNARKLNDDDFRPFLRLVYSKDDPSFDICLKRPEGGTAIRIFVGKSPPEGSNPPYVLHKVGDKWLLKNFTPF